MVSNFDEIINSEKPVVIDFFAEWCGPCKSQTPIIQEFAKEMQDKVTVLKIDIDKNPVLANKYNIMGVPTIGVFQNGQIKYMQSGLHMKNQLNNAVRPLLQ